MTVEELLIREEIRDVKARYCYYLDFKRWDDYGNLFAKNATLNVDQSPSTMGRAPNPRPEFRGRAAIQASVSDLLPNAETLHQVHSPIFTSVTPERVEAIWAMEDIVRMPGFHLEGRGHYNETYIVEDGAWRIASLHLTRTWVVIREGAEAGPA